MTQGFAPQSATPAPVPRPGSVRDTHAHPERSARPDEPYAAGMRNDLEARTVRTMSLLCRAAAAASLLAASACLTAPPGRGAQPPTIGGAQAAQARAALAALPAAGKPRTTGYDRDEFGQPWTDVDHNGCDTRNDILSRDLAATRRKNTCVVSAGVLADPYTGRTVHFRRGPDSGEVQIDHLYPLHRAWMYRAWKWPQRRRVTFANDPGNLLAVSGQANRKKGDSGPAEWRPPRRDYHCAYAVDYIDIARSYDLPVTPADRQALNRMLTTCPTQRGP